MDTGVAKWILQNLRLASRLEEAVLVQFFNMFGRLYPPYSVLCAFGVLPKLSICSQDRATLRNPSTRTCLPHALEIRRVICRAPCAGGNLAIKVARTLAFLARHISAQCKYEIRGWVRRIFVRFLVLTFYGDGFIDCGAG